MQGKKEPWRAWPSVSSGGKSVATTSHPSQACERLQAGTSSCLFPAPAERLAQDVAQEAHPGRRVPSEPGGHKGSGPSLASVSSRAPALGTFCFVPFHPHPCLCEAGTFIISTFQEMTGRLRGRYITCELRLVCNLSGSDLKPGTSDPRALGSGYARVRAQ